MRNLLYIVVALFAAVIAYGIYDSGVVEHLRSGEVSIVRRTTGSKLNSQGKKLLESGDIEGALVEFRKARDDDPTNPVVLINLSIALSREGQRLFDGGDSGGSLGYQEEALEVWPENPEALERMAIVNYRSGSYGRARRYVKKLKALQPDRTDLDALVARLDKLDADVAGMVSEQGRNFRLRYSGERKLEFEGELLSILQDQMDRLTSLLGVFPTDSIEVLVMTKELGARGDSPDPLLSGIYDGRIRLYLGEDIHDNRKLVNTVRHEMIHALLHRAGGKIPGWFHEGMAQRIGEDYTVDQLSRVKEYVGSLLKDGWLVSLGDLEGTFIGMEPEDRLKAYSVSLVFADYLIRRFGDTFVQVVVAEMQNGQSFSSAMYTATGKRLLELQAEFFKFLE